MAATRFLTGSLARWVGAANAARARNYTQADLFANRVHKITGDPRKQDPRKQVQVVFELAFGRQPDEKETSACVSFVEKHGLPALCRVVFNMNEFLFIP